MSWSITGLSCSAANCQTTRADTPLQVIARARDDRLTVFIPEPAHVHHVTAKYRHQACRGAGALHDIINTALVGVLLAPMAWLATLPLSLQFVTSMMTTLPASLLMARFGRRPVLIGGVLISSSATFTLGMAVLQKNFLLFCLGGMMLGVALGIASYYRYAAADELPNPLRPKAISYVLAGGLFAALIGPEISRRTVELVPEAIYAGCFFTAATVQLLSLFVLAGLKIKRPERTASGGRPIGVFLRMPVYIIGVLCCAVGYALMSYLMTATPLQVVNVAKLGNSANATIIQWHVTAMFLPSFFTGSLIGRFGAFRILWSGVAFYLALSLIHISEPTRPY